MNLNLTGHHLTITPAIRDYVVAKLDRVVRHFDHVIDVNVVMTVDKLQQKVEANLHTRGKDIHAEAIDGDLYAAIDALADKHDARRGSARSATATPARSARPEKARRPRPLRRPPDQPADVPYIIAARSAPTGRQEADGPFHFVASASKRRIGSRTGPNGVR